MNGNGKLTETENVIFYVSYGVFTEFLRVNVILTYFATATATATVTATDTECWKSGIRPRRQDRVLPIRRDNRNFFDRHLCKDLY